MEDKLLIATAKNDEVRIIAATTTELVSEGITVHECTPTAAAGLGRTLTAGALMGSMMKNEKDSLTIKIDGGGIAKGIIVTAHSNASVKGYIGNPKAELPQNSKGKLDVGGIVGKDGMLTVIRDLGLREPYVGQVPISTGEVGDDLAYYFTASEQVPSAVGLGVLIDTDLSVKAAGGFIIQMMPGYQELTADLIMYRLEEIPSITKMISEGMSAEDILNFIFEGMDLKIIGEMKPKYECDCTREKVERALLSIGKKDLEELYNEGKSEELKCNFCNKAYEFTHEDIGKLLNS